MESTYPLAPPIAHFRTKIFHPNVDPTSGAVCVDTLKRDWKPELTLRDVLVTISCLLMCPNPASALNADAGHLMGEDFSAFEERASIWSRMYASVPPELREAVNEAKTRVIGEPRETATPTKGKKRRGAIADSVQDVSNQNAHMENIPAARVQEMGENKKNSQHPSFLANSVSHASHAQDRKATIGLGLNNIDSGTLNMEIDTPTQAPRRPGRKRYAMLPPITNSNSPSLQASNAVSSSTPAPTSASLLSSPFPTDSFLFTPTPMPQQAAEYAQPPELTPDMRPAKRRRTHSLSPPVTDTSFPKTTVSFPRLENPLLQSNTSREPSNDPFSVSFAMPWLDWEKFLPSTVHCQTEKSRKNRESESRRGIFRL
jgi:Ubiquitin-conjugating enzyme